MLIHEAIKAKTSEKPYIFRKAWIDGYCLHSACLPYVTNPHFKHSGVPVKVLPTNSPDGYILLSKARMAPCCGWQPTAEDLVAEDWEITGAG